MFKVGVVVLNYKKYYETQECIDSILTQKNIAYLSTSATSYLTFALN